MWALARPYFNAPESVLKKQCVHHSDLLFSFASTRKVEQAMFDRAGRLLFSLYFS